MKHLKTFLVLALLVITSSISAQSTFEKWPAIKEFHQVMSQTFHPAEEGNLAPIKARSEEMMNKAALLLKSDIPEAFKTSAILASAEKLQLKSRALHKLVNSKAPDAKILKSITDLHDTFHEIVGLCSDSKK
jgi:Skp family chaperone for outer membrane proteins